MNRYIASAILFTAMLGSTPVAHALSTEKGSEVPGAYVNMADPDEQKPTFVTPSTEQGQNTALNRLAPENNETADDARRNMFRQNLHPMPFNPNR